MLVIKWVEVREGTPVGKGLSVDEGISSVWEVVETGLVSFPHATRDIIDIQNMMIKTGGYNLIFIFGLLIEQLNCMHTYAI